MSQEIAQVASRAVNDSSTAISYIAATVGMTNGLDKFLETYTTAVGALSATASFFLCIVMIYINIKKIRKMGV